jgi:glutamate decarboxylase
MADHAHMLLWAGIRRGEDDDCPVSTFTSRDELHKRVPLKLAEDGVSDEGQMPDGRTKDYIRLTTSSNADLFSAMETILDNSVNPWTGRFVDKVESSLLPSPLVPAHNPFSACTQLYSSPLPCGIAAEALLSAINANAHVISASPMLCLAEEACVSSLAALCGWDVVSDTFHRLQSFDHDKDDLSGRV